MIKTEDVCEHALRMAREYGADARSQAFDQAAKCKASGSFNEADLWSAVAFSLRPLESSTTIFTEDFKKELIEIVQETIRAVLLILGLISVRAVLILSSAYVSVVALPAGAREVIENVDTGGAVAILGLYIFTVVLRIARRAWR